MDCVLRMCHLLACYLCNLSMSRMDGIAVLLSGFACRMVTLDMKRHLMAFIAETKRVLTRECSSERRRRGYRATSTYNRLRGLPLKLDI